MRLSRRSFLQYVLFVWVALFLYGAFPTQSLANIQEFRDILSNSAPATTSNHTVEFKTTAALSPGDYIRVRPEPGSFTIPATDFGINNVALYVNVGGGFIERLTGTTTDAVTDGVTITTGTSGDVQITLNSTVGIPANARIRMLIGNHTSLSTTTDLGIINPTATGSFPIYIEKSGANAVEVQAWVAMVDAVGVGPVDTTEVIPPFRFNGAPSGTLSGTSLNVEVSLNTDEFATCRYSFASGTPYTSMSSGFTVTGSVFHSFVLPVATSTDYTIYVRCSDDEGNANTDDYLIQFSIPEFPTGNPGGTGSTTNGTASGTGSGTGNTGGGTGSSGGNTSGGGGGGGGGGGSGGGTGEDDDDTAGGGFEDTDASYPSGDAQVVISGYAFPNSNIVILVDGGIAETVRSNGSGLYTATIDAIARGVYTFGVYGVDSGGTRSSTFSTTFTVTGGRTSTLSNINVMPSIKVNPNPVNPGQTLTVSGFTIPNANVVIENEKENSSASRKTFQTTSNGSGAWTITVDTNGFTNGTYKVRARAAQTGGVSTNFSGYTMYGVGQVAPTINADLNRDGKVNLIDFSILLFWWGSDGGDSNPPADISSDGNVSLTDFSILLFNWTG